MSFQNLHIFLQLRKNIPLLCFLMLRPLHFFVLSLCFLGEHLKLVVHIVVSVFSLAAVGRMDWKVVGDGSSWESN